MTKATGRRKMEMEMKMEMEIEVMELNWRLKRGKKRRGKQVN